jgi:NAD(P)-dependent dehydrogenase (short-subunit alcohol dehydrogenase family)
VEMISLDGKIVVITGGSSGIGRATALALARNGARALVLAARREDALNQVAAEVRALGSEALPIPTDVSRQDQVQALIERALDRFGQVDILVANAGEYIRAPVDQLNIAVIERSMAVNFYGSVYPALAVLPHMRARRSGTIVFVTSMNGKKGIPMDTPYASAKFALSGFAEVLRQELRGQGIAVITIFPGRVDTPMIANLHVPWISAKIPPDAVARAIVHAIRRRQAEVIVPWHARLLHLVNVISPSLADQATRILHLEGWESEKGNLLDEPHAG